MSNEQISHPTYYGGKDNPYEAIKIIEAWKLGFNLGNTIKYILRAPFKGFKIDDLKKAKWYLEREITNLEREALQGQGSRQEPPANAQG